MERGAGSSKKMNKDGSEAIIASKVVIASEAKQKKATNIISGP
jgi:hypothetical protein